MNSDRFKDVECDVVIRAAHDAMDIVNGKWKIPILAVLTFNKKRYSEILKEVKGISGKMLSKELKDLELNQILKRNVLDTQPITVEYELTAHGQKFKAVIEQLAIWGIEFRKHVTSK